MRRLSLFKIALLLLCASALMVCARSRAASVVPGTIEIDLVPVMNLYTIDGVAMPPIDMHQPGDGDLYVASLGGQMIRASGATTSVFLNLANHPQVPFTTNFAGGLLGIVFHPDYAHEGAAGYRKFYTFSSDWKTQAQATSGASTATNTSPGQRLTGLPDFWHPEMYAPATSGNPLTNWTNRLCRKP